MKVLILCTGNSCRSQMAHGFLQSFDHRLDVHSAGTEPKGMLDPKAVEVMQEVGVDISHHSSDHVDKYLDVEWDYVITVCGKVNESCPVFVGKVKNREHIRFDSPKEVTGDPGYIHTEYARVRDQIKHSFHKIYTEQLNPKL